MIAEMEGFDSDIGCKLIKESRYNQRSKIKRGETRKKREEMGKGSKIDASCVSGASWFGLSLPAAEGPYLRLPYFIHALPVPVQFCHYTPS